MDNKISPRLRVTDQLVTHLSLFKGESEYTVPLSYTSNCGEYAYGRNRGQPHQLEFPVDEVSELDHLSHFIPQIAVHNRPATEDENSSVESAVRFDRSILELMESALEHEGIDIDALPVSHDHAGAAFLNEARIKSHPELTEQLENLGYEPKNQCTYWRATQTLESSDYWDEFKSATKRAVFTVLRAGIPFPTNDGYERYGVSKQTVIDESEISRGLELEAQRNWINELRPVTDPISFDRQNPKYSVDQILATIAQAAFADSLPSGPRSLHHHYDPEVVPSYKHTLDLINELDRKAILRMFREVTRELITELEEMGFFQEKTDYAIDPTWVSWNGDGQPSGYLINNGYTTESGTGWCFIAISGAELTNRFALNLDLLHDKERTVGTAQRLLRFVQKETDSVGRIMFDREFFNADVVSICRSTVGDNWVVRVKHLDEGEIADELEKASRGEPEFVPNVAFGGLSNRPNLYIHPIPEEYRTNHSRTHMGFITDLSREEAMSSDIYKRYLKRYNVEVYFKQQKGEFLVETQSPTPEVRLFLFYLGNLFYNLYILINRARSPRYALRLDVTPDDFLTAFVDAILTSEANNE